jgi:hypothetical protein
MVILIRTGKKPSLRLKPQPKLPSPPLFTHSIQETRNSLLLRQTSTIKVSTNNERKLILAHTILTDNATQRVSRLAIAAVPVAMAVAVGMVVIVGRRGGRLSAAGSEGSRRAETDTL